MHRVGRLSSWVVFLSAVLLAGCTAESRALQLRTSMRANADEWRELWARAVQNGPAGRENRLRLCDERLRHPGRFEGQVSREEMEASCHADAQALDADPRASTDELQFGQRWAAQAMNDARLADALACRQAQAQPGLASAQLACADIHRRDGQWAQAVPFLRAAFEAGSAEERCEVVHRIDQFSKSPAADVNGFSTEVVQRCRGGSPAVAPNATRVASPATRAPVVAAEPASPPTARAAPPETELPGEAMGSGLQLVGLVGGGSSGGFLGVEVGYGTPGYSVGFIPTIGFGAASAGGVTAAVAVVGLDASLRVYFSERTPNALTGFFHPDVFVGAAGGTAGDFSVATASLSLGAALGAEYLFNPRVGVTIEGGLRLVAAPVLGFGTFGAVGLVLHR